MKRRSNQLLMLLCCLAVTLLGGCAQEENGVNPRGLPPSTNYTSSPAEIEHNRMSEANHHHPRNTLNYRLSNRVEDSTRSRSSAESTSRRIETNLTLRQEKSRTTRIAAATQKFIASLGCKQSSPHIRPRETCLKIKTTKLSSMRFYFAGHRPNTPYTVVIPEGDVERPISSPHGVAVVDPFPRAQLGHTVIVFYVYNMTSASCANNSGFHADADICLTIANKRNCVGAPETNCNIDFLPLVYDSHRDETDKAKVQMLKCQGSISGYDECPKQMLPSRGSFRKYRTTGRSARCRPLNQRRGHSITTFQRCDYGVAIFGGWNEIVNNHLQSQQQDNLRRMHRMLSSNGFDDRKIQVFYQARPNMLDLRYNRSCPATNRNAIRRHIETLCGEQGLTHVRSLVLYLNSPTTSNGSMLLSDVSENGKVDRNEIYTVHDFLRLIKNCQAERVFVFADQSNSNAMASALKKKKRQASSGWRNVLLLTSDDEPTVPATERWEKLKPSHAVSSLLPQRHNDLPNERRTTTEDVTIYGKYVGSITGSSRDISMGCQQEFLDESYHFDLTSNRR